jgi:hypothetical protein
MSSMETFVPQLVIEHTGQAFALPDGTLTIGRAEDNALILADPAVSAHHATITWQAETGTFVIADLNSTQGTFVNERPVAGPQPLRHGDVIRMGATVIDVLLESPNRAPGAAAPFPPAGGTGAPASSSNQPLLIGILIAVLAGFTIICFIVLASLLLGGGGSPEVVIHAPQDGAQIALGSEVVLQVTASGAKDIVRLEVSVDGAVVGSNVSVDLQGESTLSIAKPWRFASVGQHTVSAVAYTAGGKASRTDQVRVEVVSTGIGELPTSTPTPEATTPTSTPVPTETATPQPNAPQVEYFRVAPQSIEVGECAALEWGKVADANEARIDPDVGEVATPGRAQVCPGETTTYVLTATGPGGVTTASAQVSVSQPLADLTVDAINFQPYPPVQAEDTEVKITIRNQGRGNAGPFNWEFVPGSEARSQGRVDGGLAAGQTTIVTARWTPQDAYTRLSTVARVDINNEVAETDKSNNELSAVIQVLAGTGGPGSITSTSDAELDGYRANNGTGSKNQDVLVGNGELASGFGELVWRGFMSFDISGIPAGAIIDSAELRFYQAKVGGDPYGKLGSLVLEHVDYGDRLSETAFGTPALGATKLPPQMNAGAWYVVSGPTVISWVQADLANGRDKAQFRLRWEQETDGDGQEDYAGVESGNNFFGTGNLPVLTVNYSQ